MKDDDFFDKYVEQKPKSSTKKGSVKKDLIGVKSSKVSAKKLDEPKTEKEVVKEEKSS